MLIICFKNPNDNNRGILQVGIVGYYKKADPKQPLSKSKQEGTM
jgi:hypothetical protein